MNEEAKAARREYYRAYYRTHKQELQNHKERYWEKYVQRAKQTKTTKDGEREAMLWEEESNNAD